MYAKTKKKVEILYEIQMIDIKSLILPKNNPRTISKDAMQKLCDSLKKDPDYFNQRPVLAYRKDDSVHVYAGNQRVRAAKKIGWKQVPCIIEECLSEELMKERMIKDNMHHGEWDYDTLANEFDIDMLLNAGFTPEQLHLGIEDITGELEEDSEILEPGKDEDARTKLGDVYELNGHRLVCGDSTIPDVVEKCLNGNIPILMCTDPPYNLASENKMVARNSNNKMAEKLKNSSWDKNFNIENFLFSIEKFIPYDFSIYIFTSHHLAGIIWEWMKLKSSHVNWCVWKKQNPMPSLMKRHWTWDAELICYCTFGKHIFNFPLEGHAHSTFEFTKVSSCDLHPTMKPIGLIGHIISHSSNKNQIVIDPFLGSGTTLIAAEQLGRICYGIELSPAYCDIIVDRWVKYMVKGNKEFTVKINGETIEL